MGRIAYRYSEEENYWDGFLYDLDCKNDATVTSYFAPGLPTEMRTNPETAVEAHDGCKTIITSNGKDFVRTIVEQQRRENNDHCRDHWGLVVLPNAEFEREYALKKADIRYGLVLQRRVDPMEDCGLSESISLG